MSVSVCSHAASPFVRGRLAFANEIRALEAIPMGLETCDGRAVASLAKLGTPPSEHPEQPDRGGRELPRLLRAASSRWLGAAHGARGSEPLDTWTHGARCPGRLC